MVGNKYTPSELENLRTQVETTRNPNPKDIFENNEKEALKALLGLDDSGHDGSNDEGTDAEGDTSSKAGGGSDASGGGPTTGQPGDAAGTDKGGSGGQGAEDEVGGGSPGEMPPPPSSPPSSSETGQPEDEVEDEDEDDQTEDEDEELTDEEANPENLPDGPLEGPPPEEDVPPDAWEEIHPGFDDDGSNQGKPVKSKDKGNIDYGEDGKPNTAGSSEPIVDYGSSTGPGVINPGTEEGAPSDNTGKEPPKAGDGVIDYDQDGPPIPDSKGDRPVNPGSPTGPGVMTGAGGGGLTGGGMGTIPPELGGPLSKPKGRSGLQEGPGGRPGTKKSLLKILVGAIDRLINPGRGR